MDKNVPGQLGEWASPTGEKIAVMEHPVRTNINWDITAVLDGSILPFNIAFSTAVSQRDYWRKVAEEARTKLADLQAGETPIP
jgi:hypothetical protein